MGMLPNRLMILQEGIRLYRESLRRKAKGWRRFEGDGLTMCRQIVKDCWNGRFFQSSTGHFRQFYARDFGISVNSLLRSGYQRECIATLRYALSRYRHAGRITSAITPSGAPFDFPNTYSPDSAALLVYALAAVNNKEIVQEYQTFLQRQIHSFFVTVVDPESGLCRRRKHFGGMKDYAIRDGSCYDSAMIGVMKDAVERLGVFDNPLHDYHVSKAIVNAYWTGSYFRDDLSADRISGDANVVAFFFNVLRDRTRLKQALQSMEHGGLTLPIPVRYDPPGVQTKQVWYERLLVPGWERAMAWSNLGVMYLTLLEQANKKKHQETLAHYHKLIEQHGTLFECYTPEGVPYRSGWYHADEGMLWASVLLVCV